MKKLEVEKRFLLKRLPKRQPLYTLDIVQYYWLNPDSIYERVRKEYNAKEKKTTYYHTVKTYVSPGVNEEVEREISEKEFFEYSSKSKWSIHKTRYVYEFKNQTWEVDKFVHFSLIIAEIELDNENSVYWIPEYINSEILIEVTENSKFANLRLALNQ